MKEEVNKGEKIESDYIKVKAKKLEMSQLFEDDARVIPYTNVRLVNERDIEFFKSYKKKDIIKISGVTKGCGFAGTVKRWGFRAGPRTHGQLKHRSPGSIGTQGQGRVIPGRKMPGRMGNRRKTIKTKFLGFDQAKATVQLKGAVPGSRNSELIIFVNTRKENEG